MTQLLVRQLAPGVKERLRERARQHGRSLEAEVRDVLTIASQQGAMHDRPGLGTRINARFKHLGAKSVDLDFELRGNWGMADGISGPWDGTAGQ